MSGSFLGIYGHTRCTECGEEWRKHEQPGSLCPRFSIPATIRRLWQSFGTRPRRVRRIGCPCAQCRHS